MKRITCLVLVFALVFCFAGTAFAISGTVHVSTWLNLRKSPSTDAVIIAYMKDGTPVTILDEANKTNGFYHISGYSYTNHHDWSGGAYRTGYGSASFIK